MPPLPRRVLEVASAATTACTVLTSLLFPADCVSVWYSAAPSVVTRLQVSFKNLFLPSLAKYILIRHLINLMSSC